MYDSTEVAYATIATPSDLAAEPGCVGRAVPGATVKVFDDRGREAPTGTTGRIFVSMMASGDVGHFDREEGSSSTAGTTT
ncbi:hypothetical protein ACL02S_02355 [Nocardia sp. 004]|uniref:hypothetical protein n=1 Tax=Nocardia sp. 004 TaxID=3385978 RepID=UPI00399F8D37